MDLNQLYYDHQISLMRASTADNCYRRAALERDAAIIAGKIERHLRVLGARAADRWEVPYRSADQLA